MSTTNPNNCSTCKHYQRNKDEELHCYAFKEAPTERCMQHTGNKMSAAAIMKELIDQKP